MQSYGAQSSDAQTVGQDEFDYYQDSYYIRLQGNARIYFVKDGKVKQFIPSGVWNDAGLDGSQIVDVNKTEFNYYKTGKAVGSSLDILMPSTTAQ